MQKIFFLTRSYLPSVTGGTIIRQGTVNNLKKIGYDVEVITVNYNSKKEIKKDSILYLPLRINKIAGHLFEMAGLFEDYMHLWIKRAYEILKDVVKEDDIVFSTSGGEMGCIILGSLLKKKAGCKFVINFHDPLNYTYVNGVKINKRPHVSREKQEKYYLDQADLIITSSMNHMNSLILKYPQMQTKMRSNYFGYINIVESVNKAKDSTLNICYGGAVGKAQNPNILAKITKDMLGIRAYFVGDLKKLSKMKDLHGNCILLEHMNHERFLKFMQNEIDINFVSLRGEYYSACVPSKIYESINLELPILGSLPNGDAKDLINKNGFGIAHHYNNHEGLRTAINEFKKDSVRESYKKNIKESKAMWSMESRIKEVDSWLKAL